MAARPPPARPHVGLHSSFNNARASMEWATAPSAKQQLPPQAAPRPVPRPSSNSSSSTLAFSYTHVEGSPNQSSKGGWTVVRKPSISQRNTDGRSQATNCDDMNGDAYLDADMVVGDFEPEIEPAVGTKSRLQQGSVKPNAEEVVNDPFRRLLRSSHTPGSQLSSALLEKNLSTNSRSGDTEKLLRETSIRQNRRLKFIDCLSKEDVDIAELRKLAWAGTPNDLRSYCLANTSVVEGYIPLPSNLRVPTLARKREEYLSLVQLAFARDRQSLDQQVWHQIEIDVPRTRPGTQLWMQETTQRSLERILYVWAIRHPASGYVQGINDLVTPFFQVFLSAYIDSDPELFDTFLLPQTILNAIEADCFWCLSRLLDGIQDNYISAQPGIHQLVARIDAPLFNHLQSQNVEFMQFAFRWMNCLLMREISVQNTIRMWDTYLAEGADAFSQFHLYVCSAFLVTWSTKLRQMDFQGIIMFLQSPPTQDWGDHEIELLLSEAFVLCSIWHNAQSHLNAT
ncbi:rab-GTPase-TBC domain-containing protein [Pisolithus microcarpus]|nr:rab-GTPase-TBC domain-containing protein [Pisolithus microcarpus]